jgi:hypothetical protein
VHFESWRKSEKGELDKKVGKRNESKLERNYEFGTVGVDVTEMQIMMSRAVLISLWICLAGGQAWPSNRLTRLFVRPHQLFVLSQMGE